MQEKSAKELWWLLWWRVLWVMFGLCFVLFEMQSIFLFLSSRKRGGIDKLWISLIACLFACGIGVAFRPLWELLRRKLPDQKWPQKLWGKILNFEGKSREAFYKIPKRTAKVVVAILGALEFTVITFGIYTYVIAQRFLLVSDKIMLDGTEIYVRNLIAATWLSFAMLWIGIAALGLWCYRARTITEYIVVGTHERCTEIEY